MGVEEEDARRGRGAFQAVTETTHADTQEGCGGAVGEGEEGNRIETEGVSTGNDVANGQEVTRHGRSSFSKGQGSDTGEKLAAPHSGGQLGPQVPLGERGGARGHAWRFAHARGQPCGRGSTWGG